MNPHATRVMDTVDQMLLEAGQEDAGDLRCALLALGALAAMPVPAPGPRLAGLLAGSPAPITRREAIAREAAARESVAREGAGFRSDELARRRALRRNRSAVVGLTVIAGMGLGATGVAASLPDMKQDHASVQQLLQDWVPRWTIAEAGATAGEHPAAQEPALQGAEAGPTGSAVEESVIPAGPGRSGSAGNGKSPAPKKAVTAPEAGSGGTAVDDASDKHGSGHLRNGGTAAAAEPAENQQARAGNSGAGQKASPGARWLKKFNQ